MEMDMEFYKVLVSVKWDIFKLSVTLLGPVNMKVCDKLFHSFNWFDIGTVYLNFSGLVILFDIKPLYIFTNYVIDLDYNQEGFYLLDAYAKIIGNTSISVVHKDEPGVIMYDHQMSIDICFYLYNCRQFPSIHHIWIFVK